MSDSSISRLLGSLRSLLQLLMLRQVRPTPSVAAARIAAESKELDHESCMGAMSDGLQRLLFPALVSRCAPVADSLARPCITPEMAQRGEMPAWIQSGKHSAAGQSCSPVHA